MNSIEERILMSICVHLKCANSQRITEVRQGLGHHGTSGYETMGCYDCNGNKKDCPTYTPEWELENYTFTRRDRNGTL